MIRQTKIVIIVHLLVVFFLIGRFKRLILTPSFTSDISDAFIIVIMTAINCCLTYMIICYMFIKLKGPEFKERYESVIISNANRLLKEFANMKGL